MALLLSGRYRCVETPYYNDSSNRFLVSDRKRYHLSLIKSEEIPNQEWDIEHAKVILIQNNSLLRKVLARLYVR